MDPELAARLRRYGEQVDDAAIAVQAVRPPVATGHPADAAHLPTVVPIAAARNRRRPQPVVAAVAAAIVVLAGAAITWRIAGDDSVAPADSGQTTLRTSVAPTATTAVASSTTLPIVPGPDGSGVATTSTTTTPDGSIPAPNAAVPGTSPTCPDGYRPYDASYPIRQCDRGPAVVLIQQHTGASADGFFGPTTAESVRVFQRRHGLNDDGLVGPLTWAAMFPDGAPGADRDGNGTVEPWEVG